MIRKIVPLTVFSTVSLLLTLVPFTTLSAQALDLKRFVDEGRTTLDAETGLRWLDLTESRSLSYLEVSGELGSNGLFEGYRYATESEISDLIGAFQVPFRDPDGRFLPGTMDSSSSWRAAKSGAYLFLDLFGETERIPNRRWVWSLIRSSGMGQAFEAPANQALAPVFRVGLADPKAGPVPIATNTRTISLEESSSTVGSFLVRENRSFHAVPEIDGKTAPLALGLLLMCYLLMGEIRRSKGIVNS